MTEAAGPRAPVIVLVGAQMGENIGAAARAMHNFALSELRLVRPRDGWPNPAAEATATEAAGHILAAAKLFNRLEEALGDIDLAFALTARDRYLQKAVVEPADCVEQLILWPGRAAIVFGSERAGLSTDEVALCDRIVTIPANPEFPSLNLAQAVALMCWEWQRAHPGQRRTRPALHPDARAATKGDLTGFFEHLEAELDRTEFLFPPAKRTQMVRTLRSMWTRAGLTYQEVQTLRGIVTALTRDYYRKDGKE